MRCSRINNSSNHLTRSNIGLLIANCALNMNVTLTIRSEINEWYLSMYVNCSPYLRSSKCYCFHMAVDMAQHDIVVQAHRIRYEPKQRSYRWIAKADLQLLTQLDEPCSQWDVGSKLKAVNIRVRSLRCGPE